MAEDYQVGRGRPPRQTRWKKGGSSPNPKGRPKGRKNIAAEIEQALCRMTQVTMGNVKIRTTSIQGLVLKLMNEAGKLNKEALRALPELIQICHALQAHGASAPAAATEEACAEDKDILDALERDLRQRIIRTDGGGDA